jgi:hypothetical protein
MKFGKYVKHCYWRKIVRRGREIIRPGNTIRGVKGQGILGTPKCSLRVLLHKN